ncbi:MoeA, N-terminal and linker domain-containing protein [Xylogone sp. PMI_703]|nr:MoeA, N-terminal and linker domain-containing protein [Xylogone sp. PMI_703]
MECNISYASALSTLQATAHEFANLQTHKYEVLPIVQALGQLSADTIRCPISTPRYSTSAVDGYAVQSSLTREASAENPLTLKVIGTIAAGQVPISVSIDDQQDESIPCVEIMTGARFPIPAILSLLSPKRQIDEFDASIKVEETVEVNGADGNAKYIQIKKPARRGQNWRPSGNDFREGKDIVLNKGERITPTHVMALASLGIGEIAVQSKLKVTVVSTGLEMLEHDTKEMCKQDGKWVRDCNGPYIEAFLNHLGVDARREGIIRDDPEEFQERILSMLHGDFCDIIICTGAVSMGKFDFVRSSIEHLGAKIQFHKVAIRPGHPILFATLPTERRASLEEYVNGCTRQATAISTPNSGSYSRKKEVAFFRLPGNPIAAAVCLRFLVVPYLRALGSDNMAEVPKEAVVNSALQACNGNPMGLSKPAHLQTFWHGKRSSDGKVVISKEQGSSQIRPLLDANCWISIPPGEVGVRHGDKVQSFEMYPLSLSSDKS